VTLALAIARASLKIRVQFREMSIKYSGALRNGSLNTVAHYYYLRSRVLARPPEEARVALAGRAQRAAPVAAAGGAAVAEGVAGARGAPAREARAAELALPGAVDEDVMRVVTVFDAP
jgi:hypothetical protein